MIYYAEPKPLIEDYIFGETIFDYAKKQALIIDGEIIEERKLLNEAN